MNKDYFIRLTFAVYRVTGLFPEDESLKLKIRESANKILNDLILLSTGNPVVNSGEKRTLLPETLREIEVLEQYFAQSQEKTWINPLNFLILKREYDKIKRLIQELNQKLPGERENFVISPRQKKILEILKERKKIQMGELIAFFSDLNRRTLIRDLEELFKAQIIKRDGDGRGTYYSLESR